MLSSLRIYKWNVDMVCIIITEIIINLLIYWQFRTLKKIQQILIKFQFSSLTPYSCKIRDQYAKGCKSVSPSPFQMGLATALDPARDLQRLNTLIINNSAGFAMLNDANGSYSKEPTVQDDPTAVRKTIMALTKAALDLDQIHRTYKLALDREMKYGSRQAPIGDDNYLHLIRNGLGTTLTAAAVQQHNNTNTMIHHHHSSPKFYRNEVLRNSFNNDKLSQY